MESKFRYLGGRNQLVKSAAHLLQGAGRILFPHFCLSCGTEGKLLCQQCITQHALNQGVLFSVGGLRCFAAGRYSNPTLRQLLHIYKYGRVGEAGHLLADYFIQTASRQVGALLTGEGEPVVVPVPMHPVNRSMRGFNQVEILAEVLAADFELELVRNALKRSFSWRAQAHVSNSRKRLNNVSGVFSCGSEVPKNRNVLLVDDVLTTGATIQECARVLRQAGVGTITAVTALRG